MPRLSPHILETPHSGIRRMGELAATHPDPLMLVSGDPDFVTPTHIIDAAASAARDGATGYAPSAGIAPLRTAIAAKVRDRNGLDVSEANITVTTGGCGGLFSSFLVTLGPGDEVLVPDPGWSNYGAILHVLRLTGVPYPLDAGRGFVIDPEAIEGLVTPRTRAILLNTPNNPTGTVEATKGLRAVLELAERHDLWVVSDECYDELIFEGRHVSTGTLGSMDRLDHHLHVLQDIRDDRMARGLRSRAGRRGSSGGTSAGARGVMHLHDLPTGGTRRAQGPAGHGRSDGRRIPATP